MSAPIFQLGAHLAAHSSAFAGFPLTMVDVIGAAACLVNAALTPALCIPAADNVYKTHEEKMLCCQT